MTAKKPRPWIFHLAVYHFYLKGLTYSVGVYKDPRPKTQKRRLVFFTGLSSQRQSNRVDAFLQTPTDAKSVVSSFCTEGRLELQKEDPRLYALLDVN